VDETVLLFKSTFSHLYPKEMQIDPTKMSRQQRLLVAMALCSLFCALEFAGGIFTGSLAILSDSFHMLGDVLSYTMAFFAIYYSSIPKNNKFTYGYKRFEVVGAILSIIIIWGLSLSILVEACFRFTNPEPIDALTMIYISIAGVVVNVLIIYTLGHEHGHCHGGNHNHYHHENENLNHAHAHDKCNHENEIHPEDESNNVHEKCNGENHAHTEHELESFLSSSDLETVNNSITDIETARNSICATITGKISNDLNIRAAVLHAIGDLVCSIGVVFSAIIIYFRPDLYYVDPLFSIIFVLIALSTTIGIIGDIFRVIMQSTPSHVDIGLLESVICGIDDTVTIKECQISMWNLSSNDNISDVLITVPNSISVYDSSRIVKKIKEMMKENYNSSKCTVEISYYVVVDQSYDLSGGVV
jgi:zinc transporter 2